MPGSRRCQVKRNRRTDEPARPPSKLAYARDKYLAENLAFGLVCRVGRRFPSLAPAIAKAVAGAAGERDLIDRSDRVFASPRHVRFVEMEYGVPVEHLPEAVDRVRHLTTPVELPDAVPDRGARVGRRRHRPVDRLRTRERVGRRAPVQGRPVPRLLPGRRGDHGRATAAARTGGSCTSRRRRRCASAIPNGTPSPASAARLDPDGTFRNDYLDRVLGPDPDLIQRLTPIGLVVRQIADGPTVKATPRTIVIESASRDRRGSISPAADGSYTRPRSVHVNSDHRTKRRLLCRPASSRRRPR